MNNLLTRLLMIVAIGMVPAVIFQIYSVADSRHVRKALIEEEALRLVDIITLEQRKITDGAEQALDVLRGASAIQDSMPEHCQRLLQNLVDHSPRYAAAKVIGLDGRIRCAPSADDIGLDVADRAYFQEAMETGASVIGEYAISRTTGLQAIQIAKPFTDRDGNTAGAVELSLSLNWLGEQLRQVPLPQGAGAIIADRNGTILARHADSGRYVGEPMLGLHRFVLEGERIAVKTVVGQDGPAGIVAYSPPRASSAGLAVAVMLRPEIAFAEAGRANGLGFLLIAAGCAAALFLTSIVGNRLIRRPVKRLLTAAADWRSGALAAHTGLRKDNSEFGRLGSAFDEMAEALEDRQRTLRMALDSTTDHVIVIAADWRVTYLNEHAIRFLGGRDVSGQPFWGVFSHLLETNFETSCRLAMRSRRPETIETRCDRGASVFETKAYPSEGGLTLFVRNVTEERRAITALRESEAAQRRLSVELERRVAKEVAAREAAQSRAAQAERMQALGQLAGGIAHDFNNVLQAVSGAIALIERRAVTDPATQRLTKLAGEAADRGASITRRLLAFGRRGDLHVEMVDAADLLREMQEVLTHTLGANINVQVRIGKELQPIMADRRQLETVLVNLATNARDAMPGGGRLILSANDEVIATGNWPHPAGLTPGAYIRLTVTDTGAGMDAETLARSREPFFTTKQIGAGTGLGLSMAQGFAEQSGGTLNLESDPGEGTTVNLWLPQVDRTTVPPAHMQSGILAAQTAAPGSLGRVLLVDDESIVREVLTEYLEQAGYQVLVAVDGTEALTLLDADLRIDALVTDLSMPGIDGLSVIRAAQERFPLMPAVLLTGFAGDDAALALGTSISGTISLLRKPVHDVQLLDRLGAMLAIRPGGRGQHQMATGSSRDERAPLFPGQ